MKYIVAIVVALLVVTLTPNMSHMHPGSFAQSPPLPTVAVTATFTNELAQSILPITVNVSNNQTTSDDGLMTFFDIRYCGAETSTRAKLLAVARPGAAPLVRPISVLTAAQCGMDVTKVADDIIAGSNSPTTIAVVSATATWIPWELSFAVQNVVARSKTTPTIPLSQLETKLRTTGLAAAKIQTGGFRVNLEQGGELIANIAPAFTSESLNFTLVPAEMVEAFLSRASITPPTMVGGPAHANALIRVPYGFVNFLSVTKFAETKIPVKSGQVNVEFSNPRIQGKPNGFTLFSTVTHSQSQSTSNVELDITGTELRVAEIRVRNPPANCNSLPIRQRPACIRRNVTLDALVLALTGELNSKYRGRRLFRPIDAKDSFPVTINGKEMKLYIQVMQVSPNDTSLSVYSQLFMESQ